MSETAANTSEDGPEQNRIVVVETVTRMKPKRYRTEAKLSIGRLLKLVLCWLGIPASIAFGILFGRTADLAALDVWFYTGSAMLALNLSGIVPIRRYSRIEIADEQG